MCSISLKVSMRHVTHLVLGAVSRSNRSYLKKIIIPRPFTRWQCAAQHVALHKRVTGKPGRLKDFISHVHHSRETFC